MLITFLFVYNLTFIKAVRMNEDTTNKIEENGIVAYQNSRFKAHMKVPISFSDHILSSANFFLFLSIPTRTQFQPTFVQIILGFKELIFFSNEGQSPFPTGGNSEVAKTH